MKDATSPRLSVHMLVRDVATVVARALRPLAGIASEVCFVDTGSTDNSPTIIRQLCGEIGATCIEIDASPAARPNLFFDDLPSAYAPHHLPDNARRARGSRARGSRARGSRASGSLPLLRDWSAARNLGLKACQGQYVLKLDADDEVMTPENLLPALEQLDARPNIDVLACPYEVMDGKGSTEYFTMYTRLWRNKSHGLESHGLESHGLGPEIRFREVCHENVDWCRKPDGSNWIMVSDGLHVRDWRDNVVARVPHRNLKVLIAEYVRCARMVKLPSQHVLIYLADEAAEVMPELALEVLDRLKVISSADEAWYRFILAVCYEKLGQVQNAETWYRSAVIAGWERAALRCAMMMARRKRKGWQTLLELAIEHNEKRYYPRHASVSEVESAKAILKVGRAPC